MKLRAFVFNGVADGVGTARQNDRPTRLHKALQAAYVFGSNNARLDPKQHVGFYGYVAALIQIEFYNATAFVEQGGQQLIGSICRNGEDGSRRFLLRPYMLYDQSFQVRKMFTLNALYEHVGTSRWL